MGGAIDDPAGAENIESSDIAEPSQRLRRFLGNFSIVPRAQRRLLVDPTIGRDLAAHRQPYAIVGECPAKEPGFFSLGSLLARRLPKELPIYFRCLHDDSIIGRVTAIVPAPVLGRICRNHCGDTVGAAETRCPGASPKSARGVVLHHNCRYSPCFVERLFPMNSLS